MSLSSLISRWILQSVLAVEIRQYVGEGQKTLVPKVIGQIPEKKQAAIVDGKWNESSFFKEIAVQGVSIEVEAAKAILDWAKENVDRIWWGEGKTQGSFSVIVEHNGVPHYPIAVFTKGVVYINFYQLKNKPPFDNEDLRKELLRRINEVPGVNISQEYLAKGPAIPLKTFENCDALDKFFSALAWVIKQIRSSN